MVEVLKPKRDPSYNPIFQTMFVYQDEGKANEGLPNLAAERIMIDAGIAKFDLTLFARHQSDGMMIALEYDAALFERATIERFLAQYETLLLSIVQAPDTLTTRLNVLPSAERHLLIETWTQTARDYPRDMLIHQLIAQQDQQAIAVADARGTLSYAELHAQAGRLAHWLRTHGVRPNTPVGLCVERSRDLLIGILGILHAGGAYVPIDPTYPAARIAHIVQDADIRLMVTQRGISERFQGYDVESIALDSDDFTHYDSALAFDTTQPADSLAYIIYTSGSTGTPKGVRISHRNLVHSTTARFHFYPHAARSFLLLSSFAFDSSVVGIFWTLCQGGVLVLPPPQGERDVTQLATLIEQHHVTHTLMLPSLYQILLDFAAPARLTSLNTIMVAGEACPTSLVTRHYATLPHATLYNEYGPTEGTVWATAWQIPAQSARMLIGKAIPNMQTYILDPQQQPLPLGVAGELYIGGEGIAEGYHQRPQLTAERFIMNPFGAGRLYRTGDLARYLADGNIEFLGRIDQQVKISGYRVELGEIESVLVQHPSVQESAVLVVEATASAQAPTLAELAALLAAHPNGEALLAEIAAMDTQTVAALLKQLNG
jgi:amino acid adenylation domain-containing protein